MGGLYVQLDTNWPDHPKVIAAGLDGAGLHAIALCLAKRLGYDGVLHRTHLVRLGGTPELIDRLVEIGLLDPVDKDRVAVHDWLDRNPSREAIRGRSSWDGRRGNHKRWGHHGDVEHCSICNTAEAIDNSQVIGRVSGGESPPRSPSRSGTRVGFVAIDRDRDRDRDISDPTPSGVATSLPPRDTERNLTGIAEARERVRHHAAPDPTDPPAEETP